MITLYITFDTESIPLAELLVPDEVDVGPGFGDEWVRVCVGEAAEGVGAGGGEVRPTHGALHGVQGRVQSATRIYFKFWYRVVKRRGIHATWLKY